MLAQRIVEDQVIIGDSARMASKIFFSYSHADTKLYKQLRKHFAALERATLVQCFADRQILPGDEWDHVIKQALDECDLVLLLVSPDFIASQYCYEEEVQRALERNRTDPNQCRIVPVFLRPCDFKHTAFSRFQGVPRSGAITTFRNRDIAFKEVATFVRELAERGAKGTLLAEPPRSARPESRALAFLPHLADRSIHEERIAEVFRSARQRQRRRPILLIVHGDRRECHDFFLKRLERAIPRLLGMADRPLQRPTPVRWPSELRGTPEAVFGPAIAASIDTAPIDAGAKEIVDGICRFNGITFLPATTHSQTWGKRGGDLLNAYLAFWRDAPEIKPSRALVLALSIKYENHSEDEVIRRKLEEFLCPETLDGVVLPELRPITRSELDSWPYQREVRAVFPWPEVLLDRLDNVFIPPEEALPMSELAERLKQVLQET